MSSLPESPVTMLDRLLQEEGLVVTVGLRQQGHMPTVERMLAKGASWEAIGDAIGWHGPTAEKWYSREKEAPARFPLAERQPDLLLRGDSSRGHQSLAVWDTPAPEGKPPWPMPVLEISVASGLPVPFHERAALGESMAAGCLLSYGDVDSLARWLAGWLERNKP